MTKLLKSVSGTRAATMLAMTFAGVTAVGAYAQTSRTVWEGVYTADQAARGKATYAQSCASCHGESLAGIDVAPALSSSTFASNWNGTSAGDLFERIHTTMPLDDPGSLSNKQVADVEAFIFQTNGYPAGANELAPGGPALAGVKILSTKPAQ
jgi:mono/diheme cytochrome c family protein